MPFKSFDIATPLDLCVDFLVDMGNVVPEFDQKEQIIKDYTMELGGSAVIFASQAAKLGLRVAGVGRVGEDSFGDFILTKLKFSGIVSDFVVQDPKYKTGVGVALCKKNDRSILTYTGSIDSLECADFSEYLIDRTRHFHIASYFLMKRLQPGYLELLKRIKSKGITVSLDTNWDPEEKWDNGILDILPYVDIFLPNENEARLISGKSTLNQAINYLTSVVSVLVVKRGEKGAIAFKDGNSFSADALPVKIVDAVGAGDNFDAGFIYGFLSNYKIDHCLTLGIQCGSASVTQPGGMRGQLNKESLERNFSPIL